MFTQVSFSGKLDSRGRVTVPSRIRDRLELEQGDRISLKINSTRVLRKEFSDEREALKFASELEDVEQFSFDGEVLEVVLNE